MKEGQEVVELSGSSARALGRMTAQEISNEELATIAGGSMTGSHWPYPLPPTDVDREL